jgi:hypothetical protein
MAERMVTALDTPSMAALSRTLSHTMFKLNSLLFFVSDVALCLKTVSEPVYLIELVVVTVVGGGELVENPEKPCRNAGVLVSTGL